MSFRSRPDGTKYPIATPPAVEAIDKATSQRIKDVAFGITPPTTVEEAQLAVRYLQARKDAEFRAGTERSRAALELERGTGTMAHIRRVARSVPQYSSRARIELERRARRAVGGTVRGLFRDVFGPDQPYQYPPIPQTLGQQASAEVERRKRTGRPRTQ